MGGKAGGAAAAGGLDHELAQGGAAAHARTAAALLDPAAQLPSHLPCRCGAATGGPR